MTIYAHFEGKQDILRYLCGHDVSCGYVRGEIQNKLKLNCYRPVDRLQMLHRPLSCIGSRHPDLFVWFFHVKTT